MNLDIFAVSEIGERKCCLPLPPPSPSPLPAIVLSNTYIALATSSTGMNNKKIQDVEISMFINKLSEQAVKCAMQDYR